MLDLIQPDSGEITVLGNTARIRPSVKIGVVLGDGGFPSAMKRRTGEHASRVLPKNWNAEQFASLHRKFGIDREKAIRDYSKGMKTKLNIAAALSHSARLP